MRLLNRIKTFENVVFNYSEEGQNEKLFLFTAIAKPYLKKSFSCFADDENFIDAQFLKYTLEDVFFISLALNEKLCR